MHSITLDVHGLVLRLCSGNRALIRGIQKKYLPFFGCVSGRQSADCTLYVVVRRSGASGISVDPWQPAKAGAGCGICGNDISFYDLPGTGSALWSRKEGYLLLEERTARPGANVKYLFYTILFDWLAQQGYFVVHGCGMSDGAQGMLLLGPDGSGKSTQAVLLTRRGFDCLGDNVVLLKHEKGRVLVYPLLPYISLTRPDAKRFPECLRLLQAKKAVVRKPDKVSFRADALAGRPLAGRVALSAVCFLGASRNGVKMKEKNICMRIIRSVKEMNMSFFFAKNREQIEAFGAAVAHSVSGGFVTIRALPARPRTVDR